VAVQLRVVLPQGGLRKGRHDQPASVGELPAGLGAHTGAGAVVLEVLEHSPNCDVVRLRPAVVARQGPQDRDRFGDGEGGVETAHRSDQAPVGVHTIVELRPQHPSGHRVAT